jgi:cytoskeletal protein CcmA (bactofilin family)
MALFGRDDRDARTDASPPVQPPTPLPTGASATVAREPAPVTPAPRVETPETGELMAHLGRGSRVSGKLAFDGAVRVDGQVEGEISAQNTLVVGEHAVVTAQISGSTVIIRGKVTGDINAKKRVEIHAPGKLFGNIVTPSLVIHDGVMFEGHCSMGGGADSRVPERKVAPFPKEEKGGDGSLNRVPSEATK